MSGFAIWLLRRVVVLVLRWVGVVVVVVVVVVWVIVVRWVVVLVVVVGVLLVAVMVVVMVLHLLVESGRSVVRGIHVAIHLLGMMCWRVP